MQRKFILIALSAIVLAGVSCSKALDVTPKDVVLDNQFLKDYYDAEFMLRGAYQSFQP